jgi:hypothetical protein
MFVVTAVLGYWARRIPYPVERIKLYEVLEAQPGNVFYHPSTIALVAFGPDPAEDYAESLLPVLLCQVRISMCNGLQLPMIVSAGDAARIREWAVNREIAVSDPDCYSSRGGPR